MDYFITMDTYDDGFYFTPINGNLKNSIIEIHGEPFLAGFMLTDEFDEEDDTKLDDYYELTFINLKNIHIIGLKDVKFTEEEFEKKKEEIKQIYM